MPENDAETSPNIGPDRRKDDENKNEYEAAKDEWDQVQTVQLTEKRKAFDVEGNNKVPENSAKPAGGGDGDGKTAVASSLLTFDELWQYVQGAGVHGVPEGWHSESNVRNGTVRIGNICFPCSWSWVKKLCPPPALNEPLKKERDTVCALAACQFENDNDYHVRSLKTIYRRLVGGPVEPARYGAHWEDVGFQGVDPSTDLRGVGFLSLVNALYLVNGPDPRVLRMARDVHRLSTDARQNFPFMVLCINVTRIALLALKEGQLNQLCNENGTVIGTVNEFYAAVLFHIYWRWKTEGRTIADSSPILQESEAFCRGKPGAVIKRMKNHLDQASS